jgi:hypothetical protein
MPNLSRAVSSPASKTIKMRASVAALFPTPAVFFSLATSLHPFHQAKLTPGNFQK